jgi:hypothetical protein
MARLKFPYRLGKSRADTTGATEPSRWGKAQGNYVACPQVRTGPDSCSSPLRVFNALCLRAFTSIPLSGPRATAPQREQWVRSKGR